MHSLANRLALLFAAIVALAIGVVYLYVVPPLQSSLQNQKLEALLRNGRLFTCRQCVLTEQLAGGGDPAYTLLSISGLTGDRVSLLAVNRAGGLYPFSDSVARSKSTDLKFPAAREALRRSNGASGIEVGPSGRVAEAALPIVLTDADGHHVLSYVAVFSAPLADVDSSVDLIRNRILIAGAIALVLAILLGVIVARAFSRRVVRLQRSAARVAAGDFTARFPDESPDELGDLARTLDMMQRQLAELDDARKRFIATASHELRTPIFSLGGFLELLEDEDMDPETRRQFVRELRAQAARLTRLATDLLDLSRLEAGSVDLRAEPTDIGALCRMVASEFTPRADQHGSDLAVELNGEPIEATCDPDRVAQIVRVLLANALRHTPEGTPVKLGAQRSNGQVRVEVTDLGPGIAVAERERVFEPFFTSDETQGSGLGLAIAHELAERMAGQLSVQSRPGRTTFTLAIPA